MLHARRFRRVARQIGYRLSVIDRPALGQRFTRSEWQMWQEIAQPYGSTSAYIVAMLGIDPGLVSRTLRRWEFDEKLLATAARSCNRRVREVELTALGWKVDRHVQHQVDIMAAVTLDRLMPAEQLQLLVALDEIDELLARIDPRWDGVRRAFD